MDSSQRGTILYKGAIILVFLNNVELYVFSWWVLPLYGYSPCFKSFQSLWSTISRTITFFWNVLPWKTPFISHSFHDLRSFYLIFNVSGGGIFVLLVAGYFGQKYGLPPPAPKIVGIDLGELNFTNFPKLLFFIEIIHFVLRHSVYFHISSSGTTYSSIGYYHAVSGDTTIVPDALGKRSVPSVVAFLCVWAYFYPP